MTWTRFKARACDWFENYKVGVRVYIVSIQCSLLEFVGFELHLESAWIPLKCPSKVFEVFFEGFWTYNLIQLNPVTLEWQKVPPWRTQAMEIG